MKFESARLQHSEHAFIFLILFVLHIFAIIEYHYVPGLTDLSPALLTAPTPVRV